VRAQLHVRVAFIAFPSRLPRVSRESGKTLPIFWARDAHIVFYSNYADTLFVLKSDAERYSFVARNKNTKRYRFERKWPKVPCFCEEVPFSKGSPSTISRELKVLLRKNWGKSIDFWSRSWRSGASAVPACFLGSGAQKTGNAVWMGRLVFAGVGGRVAVYRRASDRRSAGLSLAWGQAGGALPVPPGGVAEEGVEPGRLLRSIFRQRGRSWEWKVACRKADQTPRTGGGLRARGSGPFSGSGVGFGGGKRLAGK
jgi:hypothetical protein